jgi:arginyl-tRNA---protein transferase
VRLLENVKPLYPDSFAADGRPCTALLTAFVSTGFSYFASTASMTTLFYQSLVDRCWRRSGHLLYRPNQKDACCPHYTLRLDSSQFRPKRDQRQAINRFNKFVLGTDYATAAARLYPRSREQAKKRDEEFDLPERIHEVESVNLATPPQPLHDYRVVLEEDTFSEEKYAIFENYQRIVHQEPPDKISRKGFRRFLCDSPLVREEIVDSNGSVRKLGSFHQCYYLDGKLVAIGVLDLLPHAVSAVYFLYHESIHQHAPGKLGALREIALAIEGGYRWWYAGFYIHSCPKMWYKRDYSPQYVLDPETLKWDLLDQELLAIFNKRHYVSLSKERAGLGEREDAAARRRARLPGGGVDGNDGTDYDLPSDEDEAFLLTSSMPGISSVEEMRQVDLDHIPLRTGAYPDAIFLTSELVVWEEDDMATFGTLKARIAELVAAIGPDLLPSICLDFRRHSSD